MTAIESDTGLTVAVLRGAQTIGSRRQITNVADAVAALGTTGIKQAIADLPRAEFPWRTSELEVLMHRSRVHAQAVRARLTGSRASLGRRSATMSSSWRCCTTSASLSSAARFRVLGSDGRNRHPGGARP